MFWYFMLIRVFSLLKHIVWSFRWCFSHFVCDVSFVCCIVFQSNHEWVLGLCAACNAFGRNTGKLSVWQTGLCPALPDHRWYPHLSPLAYHTHAIHAAIQQLHEGRKLARNCESFRIFILKSDGFLTYVAMCI